MLHLGHGGPALTNIAFTAGVEALCTTITEINTVNLEYNHAKSHVSFTEPFLWLVLLGMLVLLVGQFAVIDMSNATYVANIPHTYIAYLGYSSNTEYGMSSNRHIVQTKAHEVHCCDVTASLKLLPGKKHSISTL